MDVKEKARTVLYKAKPAVSRVAGFTVQHKENIIVTHQLSAHTVSKLVLAPLIQLQPVSDIVGHISNIDRLYKELQKELLGI